MGLFKEIKCGRCDRRYSSIRSRCPYCGARKNKGGKRAVDLGNNKWQLIAGVLILVAIIVAVVLLVSSSLKKDEEPSDADSPSATISFGAGSSETSQPISTLSPSAPLQTETPAPTATPLQSVTAISLSTYDFTLGYISEQHTIGATLSPSSSEAKITWRSEDPSIADVTQNGTVTAYDRGTTNIICEAGGISVTCIVRVTADSIMSGDSSSGNDSGSASLSHTDVTISADDNESFLLYVSGFSDVSFSSSDSDVATVDSDGTVTAISPGTAYIYVEVNGKSMSCIVRVI